eukprot:1207259-Ditylum_brightwellii.AAC.1
MDENDLVDVYKHLHPDSHLVTYLRGNKRLDYVCITPGLIPALRAAGCLPFHTGIFSDHSALFVNFDPEILFLGNLFSSIDPAMRKLKSTNPQRVDNYLEMLQAYFAAYNILERVQQLEEDFEMRLSNFIHLIDKYEVLDRSIIEAMLAAEQLCCKSKHGYAWSIKLVQTGKRVRYWKTCRSSLWNRMESDHMFHLAKALDIEDDPSLTLPDVDKRLTEARKKLKLVQSNAAAFLDTHLEEMAKWRLKDGKGDLAA